ncbi:C-type lectin BfL-1-like [Kryptolebias marmoratus]|uniref:C-type lectin BfL-1-like n=1 Tax=Kryptolebias marmoratus TaxID=37003 RepID=UPI0018ACDABF|nr:C-type lectin BfL-1-like [Kryptolebias marmoratus]
MSLRKVSTGLILNHTCVCVCVCVVQGISLQFYNKPKSWIEALNFCLNKKSSLVQNMTQTVLGEVKDLLEDETGLQDGVWVGLERSIFGTDPEWKWISGSKAENLQWNSRFPVDRFNNHCGKMILVNEQKQIQFLDASCHEELPYICEAGLNVQSSENYSD